jgi:adenine-specific DNA-methyltransferase
MIEWKKVRKNGSEQWQVYQKHYVGSALKQPSNLWSDEEGNKKATRDLNALFDDQKVFDHPKPIGLLQRILSLATTANSDDIILDFFAGSGTTGHAVWQQNRADSGNRRFMLVQLPEKLDEAVKSQQVALQFCEKLGLAKNVAELCKERLRRSNRAINAENAGKLISDADLDLGFRAFRLDRSNFKRWDSELNNDAALEQQIELHVDHLSRESAPEEILYELLLKAGFPLTTGAKAITLAGKKVFSIEEGSLLVCLEEEITPELIDALAEANPLQVICLDEGFKGNDQLKANAVQTFRARAEAEESEIVFKTV